MRAAPAVDAALGSGRVGRMLITLLHAGAGAAFLVWAAAHAEAFAGPWFAGLPWLMGSAGALGLGLVGFWLARRALPAEPTRLRWDGSSWQLCRPVLGESRSELRDDDLVLLQRVVVAMDLGTWMLLQLVPVGAMRSAQRSTQRSGWRVVNAQSVGGAWHGLRVALQVHAGAPRDTEGGDTDPPAKGPGARS
ncbi:MAG: hypothetical protein H7242_14120 [Microbacteriaceae bacterium]|nr:hypothetical protein [Burkholderiaceae bacterium]